MRRALGVARLWRDHGKRNEARDLLAPVYGWFTEGFDTLDLKEAKALLDGSIALGLALDEAAAFLIAAGGSAAAAQSQVWRLGSSVADQRAPRSTPSVSPVSTLTLPTI